ncbi:MAG: hypothetical protein PHS49_00480 [Candidatus Gracilibacteria bacterium]|nr:hypothetical protein [Candidatus Gracilibacteria bacterium]
MKITKFVAVILFFVSQTASAIDVKSIVDMLNQTPSTNFISKKIDFNDSEMDTDEPRSGIFRFQVEFNSNGFHYTIWDYHSFANDDELLVMYKPINATEKQVSSVFSINERTGDIIDILQADKDATIVYASYDEYASITDNPIKIVEIHLVNIKKFINM